MFWVTDNFLKQSLQSTKTLYISSMPEGKVKYFHNLDSVQCYSRIEANEPDCDMILSGEEDVEFRRRSSDPMEKFGR